MRMVKVLILVEGQTEEKFVKTVLAPHLHPLGIYLVPIILTTKLVQNGSQFKGGMISYGKVKRQLQNLLYDTSAVAVTTMFDYYGLSNDFPGLKSATELNCYQRVAQLEMAMCQDFNDRRLIPYLQLHEFEGLLFSAPEVIASQFEDRHRLDTALRNIRHQFRTPEEINQSPETCPHRRLVGLVPTYRKVFHGAVIAAKIGLPKIREECPHFDSWVTRLEAVV